MTIEDGPRFPEELESMVAIHKRENGRFKASGVDIEALCSQALIGKPDKHTDGGLHDLSPIRGGNEGFVRDIGDDGE